MPTLAYLDRLLDERTSLTGVMAGLRDRAAAADRDLEETERSEIARMQERCAEIDSLLTEHEAQATSARAYAALAARIEAGRESDAIETRTPTRTTAPISAGQLVVDSAEFRGYSGRGAMPAVEVEDYLNLERRAPILTTDLNIPPFMWTNELPAAATPLIDVVNVVRVGSGSVEWVEVGPDPVAGLVAEGAAKPEATLTFTPKSATLTTLAHWVQITRQALADAPYMRSLIEGKLRRGLARKIEADLTTLLNAGSFTPAVNADMTKAIRIGVGIVEGNGYRPNAVLLNPADYAAVDIAAATAGAKGPQRTDAYWGLTPVSVPGLTAGTALVGDFREAVTLFDRGVTDVFVSDSHADLFIKNILVLLAEGRYKSAITDPLAIAETAAA